ncbi:condensation domain-containing protein, partial [Mycobacterium tuberculosis]|uniref:condensation domain-containing protein n=1 Tax=Mycobacterium tuberculosis TaxID=1773 RepID=UPI00131F2043
LEEMYNSIKNGKNIELDAIPVRVVNYIEWNNKKVIENENDKKYWENKLKDVSDVLQLPFDFKRPDIQTYAGDNVIINIEDAYKEKIDRFCLAHSTTPFITMFAAYCIFLYKMTGQRKTVVGIPVSGREDAETKNMIGMFVNSLA